MSWRQDQVERGSERMQELCHLPIQLVLLGLESKLGKGCWSGTDFLCLSCAICVRSENSSGFTQSEQFCISHPMLPGERAKWQVCHSVSLQPVLFEGLGLAQRLPKGTRSAGCCDRGQSWQPMQKPTSVKDTKSAKADWLKILVWILSCGIAGLAWNRVFSVSESNPAWWWGWAGHPYLSPWFCIATTPRLHLWWGHSHDRQDRQHKAVALQS